METLVTGQDVYSESSSSKPSESASSLGDSGFQRGFLLGKSKSRRMGKSQKSTEALSSEPPTKTKMTTTRATNEGNKSFPTISTECFTSVGSVIGVVKSNENKNNNKQSRQKRAAARTPAKNDFGWAKGFLTNNKAETPTVTAVGAKQKGDQKPSKSKICTPVSFPQKQKDSGWSRGFLTKNVDSKKKRTIKQETKFKSEQQNNDALAEERQIRLSASTLDSTKAINSSNLLLSIEDADEDGNDRSSRNTRQTIATVNATPNILKARSLISVVSEENSNDSVTNPDLLQRCQQESAQDRVATETNGNIEGTITVSTPNSSTAPLKFGILEKNDADGESPPILMKAISTTRKPRHDPSHRSDLPVVRDETYSFPWQEERTESTKNTNEENGRGKGIEISVIASTNPSIQNDEDEEEDVLATSRNDYTDDNTMLKFQQEMECLLSRPSKVPPYIGCGDRNDLDDFENILVWFKTPGYRRYTWIYLLQQMQHQQFAQKNRTKNEEGKDGRNANIRRLILKLFETEYLRHYHQKDQKIVNCDDENEDTEHPLESILRCVETEEDRIMTLKAVLIIREYFTVRHIEEQEQQQEDLECERRVRRSKSLAMPNLQSGRIRRLMLLLVQIAVIPSGNRRTVLVQTTWETAIVFSILRIRDSSSAAPASSSLSSINLPTTFWEQVGSLVQQQLVWQQSKTKSNNEKITRLQGLKTKINDILEDRHDQHDNFILTSELMTELLDDLKSLIKL